MTFERKVKKQLGELLVEKKLITPGQLAEALAVQAKEGGLLGGVLVKLGYAAEEAITQAITVQYGIPYLPLSNYAVDPAVAKQIPEAFAREQCLIAIDQIRNILTIAMANPLNDQAVEDVQTQTKCNVQVFVSTMTDILAAIDKSYK